MLSVFSPFPARTEFRPTALDREVERLFNGSPVRQSFTGAADVVETEDALEFHVDLPGVSDKDVQVSVENAVLTIRAERKAPERTQDGPTWHLSERSWGTFSRSFRLPRTVDGETASAHFDHGVLTVRLPRRADAKPRTIEVKVTS